MTSMFRSLNRTGTASAGSSGNQPLDDQYPTVFGHGPAAGAQDPHRIRAIPVVQHVGQEVGIRAIGDALEEVSRHDLAAIGDTGSPEHLLRGGVDHRRQVEQDAAQMAVLPQDGRQQRPLAPADVSHGPR
jgi:hypothetical protein